MAYGFMLMLVNAGVVACFAMVQQGVARQRLAIFPFYALYSLMGCALCLLGIAVDGGRMASVWAQPLALPVTLTVLSSLSIIVASASAMMAMRSGHSGVVYTLMQSAMAFSLLASVIFWHEPMNRYRFAGLLLIVIMLVLVAPREQATATRRGGWGWFALALVSMVMNGFGQVFFVAPKHLPGLQGFDVLQVPLFMATGFLALSPLLIKGRATLSGRMAGMAVILAILGIGNLVLILICTDVLKPLALSGLVYPVATVGSLLLFSLYSRLVLHEIYSLRKWAGMTLGVGGLVLLCIR